VRFISPTISNISGGDINAGLGGNNFVGAPLAPYAAGGGGGACGGNGGDGGSILGAVVQGGGSGNPGYFVQDLEDPATLY
jgi:hypothetical protein